MIMTEYLPILIFLILAFAISIGALFTSLVVGKKNPYADKVSTYECGFDPFDDARGRFDIRFYLVAILFIIFDLEVSYLFPWAMVLKQLNLFGFWTMIVFLLILTVGFVYEWQKGALDWE